MGMIYRRSRKRFASARAAWRDVARATGIRPAQVDSAHTNTHWVFKSKKRPRAAMPRPRSLRARM